MPVDNGEKPKVDVANLTEQLHPEKENRTLNLFHSLLSAHQKHLEQFPATGKDYFSFPELSAELKASLGNLNQEEVSDLVAFWISSIGVEELKKTYGCRAVGYVVHNLIEERTTMVIDGLNAYVPELCGVDEEQRFYKQIERIFELGFSSEKAIGDAIVVPEELQGKLYDNQKLAYNAEKIAALNVFKAGIKTKEFQELYDEHNLVFLLDEDCVPSLYALFEESLALNDSKIKKETSFLIIGAQIRSRIQIDLTILSLLVQDEPEETNLLLSFFYASQSDDATPAEVRQQLERGFTLSANDSVDIIAGLISAGEIINENSIFFKKIKELEFTGDNLAEIIVSAIDKNDGDWSKIDPLIRNFVETRFSKCTLSVKGFSEIISLFVGFQKELPIFLQEYFSQEENLRILEDFKFDFINVRTKDKYGYQGFYPSPPRNFFLSRGFIVLPEVIRKTYLEKTELIKTSAKAAGGNLLNAIFESGYLNDYFYGRDIYPDRKGKIEDFDGRYFELVHKDIWDILSKAGIEVFHDFFNYHSFDNGVRFSYHDESGNFADCHKPLITCMPPEIITHLREEIFPGNQISSKSLGHLHVLGFILTDEAIEHFSATDQNFLKFYRNYPRSAEILFEEKDHLFAGDFDEGQIISSSLIELIISRGLYGEATGLIKEYLAKTGKDKVDLEMIKRVISIKCFPAEGTENFFSFFPDRAELFASLQAESKKAEWADVVSNPDQFWTNNADIIVYLTELGFYDIDFRTFRSIVNNPAITELIRDRRISFNELAAFRDKLGINVRNLSYLDLDTAQILAANLSNPDKTNFYRQLLAENPRSFKNAVYSISQNPEIDITNHEIQSRIRASIVEIGNISPMVLREYIGENDPGRRIEFVGRIKLVRQRFLQNQPVKIVLAEMGYSDDVLAELITLSFPGTSLADAKRYLPEVNDRCEDLSGFKIKEVGYNAISKAEVRIAALREGEELDRQFLGDLTRMFPRRLDPQTRAVLQKQFAEALNFVLKSKGAFTFDQVKEKLPAVLSILYEDEEVQSFRKTNFDFSQEENVSVFLGRVSELLGVYFKDNFETRLQETLSSNSELQGQLSNLLNTKNLDQIRRNLAGLKSDADKAKLQQLVADVQKSITSVVPISAKDLAGLVSLIIESRILIGEKGLRVRIKREHKKFEYKKAEGRGQIQEDLSYKGYVSKNAASFFAKTTAGVCTAGDVGLFNRPDHFHINLVRGDTVIGNIQGYAFEYQGQRALIFRGFNPSSSFVNQTNAEFICDGMIGIVKQFAEDNKITDVFVPEQTGWHALTNRAGEGVLDYFKSRYLKPDNEVQFSFPITENVTINKFYKI